jgi:hypothetical protein
MIGRKMNEGSVIALARPSSTSSWWASHIGGGNRDLPRACTQVGGGQQALEGSNENKY